MTQFTVVIILNDDRPVVPRKGNHFRLLRRWVVPLLLDRRSAQKLGSFWRYGTMNDISSRGAGTTSLIAREQQLHFLREGLSIGIRQADS